MTTNNLKKSAKPGATRTEYLPLHERPRKEQKAIRRARRAVKAAQEVDKAQFVLSRMGYQIDRAHNLYSISQDGLIESMKESFGAEILTKLQELKDVIQRAHVECERLRTDDK